MNIKTVIWNNCRLCIKGGLVLFRLCISGDYRRLRRLKIFDRDYYLMRKGNKILDVIDPLWTYLKTDHCLAHDAVKDREDWSQFADPHPLFDTTYYLRTYFPDGLSQNPLLHYLKFGWKKGYRPGPFFDPVIYGKRCGWSADDGDPLTHYTHLGIRQGKSPSLNFDITFFLDNNPVLVGVGQEIIRHYKMHGPYTGRCPLPVFDSAFYVEQVGEQSSSNCDPLSHYLRNASDTEYLPGRLFDPAFYQQQCDDTLPLGEALIHYVNYGVFEGLYPHQRVASLSVTPVVSILVPVYNPDPAVLRNCIRSVLYQAYPHWELCLVDDCSSYSEVRQLLQEWAEKDPRIKIAFHSENGGIAKATNSAAALATGSYLGFLDNDDELTVDCLLEVVETINDQGADLVYSDEDLIGNDGTSLSVFRKPCFNMSLLLSHNYITHFVVVKRSLFDTVGGLDSRYDGAQDFDLMLKLSEVCKSIVHIPKVIYHWRASDSSTSINHDQKNYAHDAGRIALGAALDRRQIPCRAADTELNFFYRLQTSSVEGKYAILIWAENVEVLAPEFIASITGGCDGLSVEVTVITAEERCDGFEHDLTTQTVGDWKVVAFRKNEKKAEVLQRLVREASCEYVCFLDGNILQLSENWLAELAAMTVLPDAGIVCGRTRFGGGDGKSFLLPDIENSSAKYLEQFLYSCTLHMAGLHCMQEMSFARWDITLMHRDTFEVMEGFAIEDFPDIFSMAELSLRLIAAGKRILYTPYSVADKENEHAEDRTVETENLQVEKRRFQSLLKAFGDNIIPYYNRGLLRDHGIDEMRFLGWLHGNGSKI